MRPDDSELGRLLGEFIPVRIVNFKGVDMNRFRFDYDLTFAILLMNADGEVYSRFGTRDGNSETDRMSIPGLKKAMREVLALHRRRPDRPALPVQSRPPFTLANMPSFRRNPASKQECAHCHFANNFRFKELRAEKKLTKEALFQYPLPENIGVSLNLDVNNAVRSVLPRSPAQRAGIRPGDIIVRADATPVLTTADLQFALNTVPDAGSVTLHMRRNGRAQPPRVLRLPIGWRRTDISWRSGSASIPPSVGIWAEPLKAEQRKQRGIAPEGMALRVSFFFPGPEWARTRGDLKMDDVLIGIDGKLLPTMTTRQFHSHFRLSHNVGDTATLNVARGEQRLEIPVPCLDVGDEP